MYIIYTYKQNGYLQGFVAYNTKNDNKKPTPLFIYIIYIYKWKSYLHC